MLGIDELEELENAVRVRLDDELTHILTKLNREERLNDFLDLIGMPEYLESQKPEYQTLPTGKIIVLGASKVKEKDLLAIGKSLGIKKDRFEMHLDYEEGKKIDVTKWQWNTNIAVIMVGPMPHSGEGKGEYSSVISAMENEEGYPLIVRLGSGELHISKTNFRIQLEQLLNDRKVIP